MKSRILFCLLFCLAASGRTEAQVALGASWAESEPVGRRIRLTWPVTATGAVLESSAALGAATHWQVVAGSSAAVNGLQTIELNVDLSRRFFRLRFPELTTLIQTSPVNGETGVAVTRETILQFGAPLAPSTALSNAMFYAEFGGRRLLARAELSSDRRTATLFYQENLPASAQVHVTFNGNGLTDANGMPLDVDGNAVAGGVFKMAFVTLGNTGLENTAVIGHVFASEKNSPGSNQPLANVTVTVDGAEQTLRAMTDTNGYFRLQPAPAGRFFVHIDGRTAVGSQWPGGAFYPFVGKAWEAVAGRTNNLAGGSGEIFLPLIPGDALKPVSLTNDTTIHFSASVMAMNPAFADVSITVPANALFTDNGTRGGKVGIAPVPPDRLPGPLPPGLEMPLVITVQTDGGQNFDRPASICFPNVIDPVLGTPLPPNSKQALISFNHDKGEWEAVGSMTVSADGKLVCSDPGSGIRQPGWHGVGPDGSGPPPPPPPGGGGCKGDECECKPDARWLQLCFDTCSRMAAECELIAAKIQEQSIKLCKKTFEDPAERNACIGQSVLNYQARLKRCLEEEQVCTLKCTQCFGTPLPPPVPADAHSPVLAGEGTQGEQVFARITALAVFLRADPPPAPEAVESEVLRVWTELETIAGDDLERMLDQLILEQLRHPSVTAYTAYPDNGSTPIRPVHYLAEITRPSGPLLIRGMTTLWNGVAVGGYGNYTLFVPRDGNVATVQFYDPVDRLFGQTLPDFRPEAPFLLPRFNLAPLPPDADDTDQDTIPDKAELVLGTDPTKSDSDGDGVRDGVEVSQGTDPLDGIPMQQGIIASVQTLGTAVDVCAFDNVAIVAEGGAGVSVLDATDIFNPIRVAQVDTPGDAQAVACTGNLVAVADGAAGLAVIDISNRAAAFIVRQVPLSGLAKAVSVTGGLAYVGLESGVVIVVELATGRVLSMLSLGANSLQDVLAVGDAVYVLVSGRLYTLAFAESALTTASEVGAGIFLNRRMRINAGRRLLYSPSLSGFQVFDLSDPFRPAVLQAHVTPQRGWRQIVPNGSGLGIGLVGVTSAIDATDDVYLHDLSPGETNSVFLTRLSTPGTASALAIFNGLAYVADGSAGLQIVNYLPADTRGVPPTIILNASFPLDPLAQAEAGSRARLAAEVVDDVQVRNVEFYLDGLLLGTDGNFPFEASFNTALLSATKTNFTIRARATDTGGNSTWTPERTVALVADLTPPRVRRITPVDGAKVVDRITVYFSEPIRPTTYNPATVQVLSAGEDGIFLTPDDVAVSAASYPVNEETFTAEVRFAAPLPDGRYRVTVTTGVTDWGDNPLLAPVTQELRVLDATFWTGRASTAWENPLNWDPLIVPGAADRVFLGSGSVRISTPVVVRSLESLADLRLDRATLMAEEGILLRRDALLNIASLLKSTLTLADGAVLRISNQNWALLDDMTINGTIDLGQEGQLILRNRLTLQGTLRGVNRCYLRIEGATTVSGGTLEFGGGTIHVADGSLFTLASDASVAGYLGVGGPGTFINRGTLRARTSSLHISTGQFTHLGSAEVSDGALAFTGNWSGDGTVHVTQGSFTMGGEIGLPLPRVTKAAEGNVNIAGTVNLQGGTATLDAAAGSWRLNGGGLRNGTLELLDGVRLFSSQNGNSFLEAMTVKGLIEVDTFGALTVRGGLALTGTLRGKFGSVIRFEGEQAVTGGTIDLLQAGVNLTDGARLTLSETTLLRGSSGSLLGSGTLINRGTLQSDVGGLTVAPGAVDNQGTIEVIGGSTLTLGGTLTGPGPINVTQGRLILTGDFGSTLPDVRQANESTVYLRSVVDLQGGNAVFNGTTGGWHIQGGGFRNGSITLLDGMEMKFEGSPGNLLENVSVTGRLNLAQPFNSGLLTVRGGLTLNGVMLLAGNATITFEGEQVFTGSAVQFAEGGRLIIPPGAKLTLAPSSFIHGRTGTLEGGGSLFNQGKISADVAGGTLRVLVATFMNDGLLEAINDGILIAPGFP